ncbi:cytochrome P450 76T24-like [Bidens hawaiensis]|uniref:cytochrome P450 76T24-like n=1 Tax=Bidens hawaiensis TaxID=980011 RepID=UPI004049D0A3
MSSTDNECISPSVQQLVEHVSQCCRNEKHVNLCEVAFTTSLNIVSNMLFSTDFSQYDSKSSQEIKEVISGLMEIGGKPNLVDFFPILRPLDPQGLASNAVAYVDRCFGLAARYPLDRWVQMSINDMKHLFMDLIIGGTDTISATVEWAMTELIHNPNKMEIARLELMKHKHNDDKTFNEHDIIHLPYLQAVIKETLRLHLPTPFLVPRQAIHDVEVKGFIVPKNAQILCNVWAIGRDPKVWSNPNVFMPERFLEVKIDYRGQDFELIPFGAGRRSCPGLNIAHRELHTILASLVCNFDWKLEGNMRAEDLDMEEKFGLALPRNIPLVAIPVKI